MYKLMRCQIQNSLKVERDRCGRYLMVVGFTTTYASVAITTNVVSSNSAHGEVYSIQHYVIYYSFLHQ